MVNFKNLKKGECLSEVQYYTVEQVKGNKVQLKNDKNEFIVVDNNYVEKCLISASQFSTEKFITKTEAAQLFISNAGIAMTVNFNKQVKDSDVKKAIFDLYPNKGKIVSEKDFQTKVGSILKSALEGEERTMIGRHSGEVNELGRVQFVDMEAGLVAGKSYDSRFRQVDPRQINYVILKNVKYKVK